MCVCVCAWGFWEARAATPLYFIYALNLGSFHCKRSAPLVLIGSASELL